MVNILIVAGIFIVIWAVCLYQAYRRGWHDGRSAGVTEREFRELATVNYHEHKFTPWWWATESGGQRVQFRCCEECEYTEKAYNGVITRVN